MTTKTIEIDTGGHGIIRIWESVPGRWRWALPNGSEGSEDSFEEAEQEAWRAMGVVTDDSLFGEDKV